MALSLTSYKHAAEREPARLGCFLLRQCEAKLVNPPPFLKLPHTHMSDSGKKCKCHVSSLVKKYLMALSGLVLAGFVLFHMIGNLQMYAAPEKINLYAHLLHSLPPAAMWGFRGFMLLCVAVHIWTGITLAIENRIARPEKYDVKATRVATLAAKTMPVTGIVLLAFIVIHLIHFTVRAIFLPDYSAYAGGEMYDVYNMVVDGFSVTWLSVFYIVSMILLFTHLSHGCSSVFQTLGVRNEKWRGILSKLAMLYAIVVVAGFIAIPAGVLAGVIKNQPTDSLRGQEIATQCEAAATAQP